MISKEQAFNIAEAYLIKRNRTYDLKDNSKVRFIESQKVLHGKFEGEVKDVWVVPYEEEGYDVPFNYFVVLDAKTGKVLYTLGSMVYVEDFEEEGFE